MIAFVEGRVVERTDNSCIVLTSGGVGYEIYLTSQALSRLPATGEFVHFFTAIVVREDALELFGFEQWDERATFYVLTSISRVGARIAMAILSVFRPDDLRRIVAEDDMLSLTRVPGVGKKTAQQIFLELKYKLKGEAGMLPSDAAPGKGGILADAVAGLVNLGYDEEEALQTVKGVLEKEADLDVSGALRAALKNLARGCS